MMQWVLLLISIVAVSGCQTAPRPLPAELPRPANGIEAYEMGDYPTAYALLMPLAEAGDAQAQAKIGQMYWLGLGVAEDDAQAAKWLGEAARQGEPEARMALAMLYMLGSGVDQDDTKAAELLQPLAERGVPEAQFYLGLMYQNGRGVTEDPVEACKWLALAAREGHRKAGEAWVALMQSLSQEQAEEARERVERWQPPASR